MGRSSRLAALVLVLALGLGSGLAPGVAGAQVARRGAPKPRVQHELAEAGVSGQRVTAALAESEPNNNVPGDVLGNYTTGAANNATDKDDVFSVTLVAGDVFEVRLVHDFSTTGYGDMDLFLFPPGSTDVNSDDPIDGSAEWRVNREYIRFVCPPGGGGTYYVDLFAFDTDGEAVPYELYGAINGMAADFSGIQRYAGPSRYDTSAEISYQTFPEGDVGSAVIASGKGFADALSGAGLAGAVDGPLLLTDPASVPGSIWGELYRLGVNDVYIIGGTGAVSQAVEDELVDDGFTVERISGATRYDTAVAVAQRMNDADMYFGMISEAFVVCGSKYSDALAASPWAYANGMPILLTPTTSLNASTETFLTDVCDYAYVVGGSAVVNDAVLADVDAATGSGAERLAGGDRYATARAVAETLDGYGVYNNDFHFVGFACGAKYADALAGGAAAGYEGGVLLLTPTAAMNATALGAIQSNMNWGDDAAIFGGEGAVSYNAMEDAYYELEVMAP